jgi:hypothetical protein
MDKDDINDLVLIVDKWLERKGTSHTLESVVHRLSRDLPCLKDRMYWAACEALNDGRYDDAVKLTGAWSGLR